MLLANGGRELASQTDGRGNYPLSLAWQHDHTECARLLLAQLPADDRRPAAERLLIDTVMSGVRDGALVADWVLVLLEVQHMCMCV